MNLPSDPAAAAQLVWSVSLVLGLVVALVVTLLLSLIHREARMIHGGVSAIWTVGQRIANNTVHIPVLYRTNEVAAQILTTVGGIETAATAVKQHALTCPGCPKCLVQG